MAATGGCGSSQEVHTDAGMSDALVADSGTDGGHEVCPDPPPNQACCELEPGGYWDAEEGRCYVAVPGPFVPPSMTA